MRSGTTLRHLFRSNKAQENSPREAKLDTGKPSMMARLRQSLRRSRPAQPVMQQNASGNKQNTSTSLLGEQIQRDPARFGFSSRIQASQVAPSFDGKVLNYDLSNTPGPIDRDPARPQRPSSFLPAQAETQLPPGASSSSVSSASFVAAQAEAQLTPVSTALTRIPDRESGSFLVDGSSKVLLSDVEMLFNNLANSVKNKNPTLAVKLSEYADQARSDARRSDDPSTATMSIKETKDLSNLFENLGTQLPSKGLRDTVKALAITTKASAYIQAKPLVEQKMNKEMDFLNDPGSSINTDVNVEGRLGWDILSGLITDVFQVGPEGKFKGTRATVLFPEDESLFIRATNASGTVNVGAKAKLTKVFNVSANPINYSYTKAMRNDVYLSTEHYINEEGFRKANYNLSELEEPSKKESDNPADKKSRRIGANDFSVVGRVKNAAGQLMGLTSNAPVTEGLQAIQREINGIDPRNEMKNYEEVLQAAVNAESRTTELLKKHLGIDVGNNSLGATAPIRTTPVVGKVSTHSYSPNAAANINIPGAASFGFGASGVLAQKTKVRIEVQDPLSGLLAPTETLPDYMREAHQARQKTFQTMEENVKPLLSRMLAERFPNLKDANGDSSDAGVQNLLSKASPQQVMDIIEKEIIPDMDTYTDSVLKYDDGDKSQAATMKAMEKKWGVEKGGRQGFLQAINIGLMSAAMSIRDQHSVDGHGNRIDPAKERDYKEFKTKIDAALDSFNKPKFKYDRRAFQDGLSFMRVLPIDITSKKGEFNFSVSSLGQGEGPISGLTGGGSPIKVSYEAARFDHWSPYQSGTLHGVKIDLPAGLNAGFAAAGFEEKLKELGVTQSLSTILQSANVSLGANMPKVTIHLQHFDPDFRKQEDFPGEPLKIKDFTRTNVTVGANAGGGINVPLVALGVPAPGAYVGGSISGGASVTKMAHESIGSDSLSYTMKRGSRMIERGRAGLLPDSQETGKVDKSKQLPQFLQAQKPNIINFLVKMADKSSNPFLEAFLVHIPDQLENRAKDISELMDNLETDNQLNHFFINTQKQDLKEQLETLQQAKKLVLNQEHHFDTTEAHERITPEQISDLTKQVQITVKQIVAREGNDYRANLETKNRNENLGLSPEQIETKVKERTDTLNRLSKLSNEMVLEANNNNILRAKANEFASMTPKQREENFDSLLVPYITLIKEQMPYMWQGNELKNWVMGNEPSELLFDTRKKD
ncbi:hypothetical protein [Agarilytica rhodophyticola]|uniref:hypothetical protein n=1 Tax=Agarilytica rhodophyticola TaxID=1737490 RepID=UPI000B3452A6|nr:hypothetical protein [Agarilytica rhodophyticola]